MASLVAFVVGAAALLGAVKGIVEFAEWVQKKKDPEEEKEETEE